ncbi:hypothetical protein CSA56_06235 [candidate division KSB3 bacterium]|uniref:Squalene cyclase C-terminal domain-containing protein n=1 Tax=candidate division KSB3 bacterium TaxID=2044937 RepID=A0A2G6KIS1_9BACT|nr:MAG: hypothetical protein CSA56_06235 [candidate division KSB3 bacterium]
MTASALQTWLHELRPQLRGFLQHMQEEEYSYCKFSYSGDRYTRSDPWGLANLVFAVRILCITSLIHELSEQERAGIAQSILAFSAKDGTIFDPLLTKRTLQEQYPIARVIKCLKRRKFKKLFFPKADQGIIQIRRAETRQAFASLRLLRQSPHRPFSIPLTESEIEQYLAELDWGTPWGAGSHFNHLLFFLRMNQVFFPERYSFEKIEALIHHAVQWVNERQSEKDGCWYTGNPPLFEKINGAMKVINGLHAVGIEAFHHAKALTDTALSGINDAHACDNFNIVYVLYGAHKVLSDYRRAEIEQFLLNRLAIYHDFYWPEYGGFSFHKQHAADNLYGKKLTLGLPEPDIHGTAMFLWGIALIDNMLQLGLHFTIPIN